MAENPLAGMTAAQIVRLFDSHWQQANGAWYMKQRKAKNLSKRKLRKLDPHDYVKTLKSPKKKQAK
jgi:hypothetical protein